MLLYYVIAIIIIIFDQWTKWLVETKMVIGESILLIDGFLYLTSHRNQGAAFGILQGQMVFFYVITVIVIGFLVYYIQKEGKESRFTGVILGIILGGAIGNFIDRVFRGEVVDFVDTIIINYDFPIFNVADAALVVGVGLLMIKMIRDERKAKENT